jgi:transcription elongation GreA/GreB family factor
MSNKTELLNACKQLVDKRFKHIQRDITEIHANLMTETKSSAGDKHETGRAMMQLERERLGVQLSEINKLRTALHKININNKSGHVSIGSLVYTSQNPYFIAVSLGAIEIKNKVFYTISPQTPIGQLLLGKTIGESVDFNGNKITIESIE